MAAQRDVCGLGATDMGSVDNAIQLVFEQKYWPLMHYDPTTSCIQEIFPDSLINLQKSRAFILFYSALKIVFVWIMLIIVNY